MSQIQPITPLKTIPEAQIQSPFRALFRKEVKRFYKVSFQTVANWIRDLGKMLKDSGKIHIIKGDSKGEIMKTIKIHI